MPNAEVPISTDIYISFPDYSSWHTPRVPAWF